MTLMTQEFLDRTIRISEARKKAIESLKPILARVNMMIQNGPDCGCEEHHICGWPKMVSESCDAFAALEELKKQEA